MHVLDPVGRQPLADFEDADDRGPGPRGDLDRVADMIAMAVRDEDEIGLDLVGLLRAQGVVVEERVQEQAVLAGPDRPGVMAQPGDFGGHEGSP